MLWKGLDYGLTAKVEPAAARTPAPLGKGLWIRPLLVTACSPVGLFGFSRMMDRQLLNNPGAFSASPESLVSYPDWLLDPSTYPWGVEGS